MRMKQAKLIELGQMLEAWRHQVLSHGPYPHRTRVVPTGADERTHVSKVKKGS